MKFLDKIKAKKREKTINKFKSLLSDSELNHKDSILDCKLFDTGLKQCNFCCGIPLDCGYVKNELIQELTK